MIYKKEFEAIAKIIREHGDWIIAISLADYLQTRNPRFDRNRFLIACDGGIQNVNT